MGRAASAAAAGRCSARTAPLVKKDLSIRPRATRAGAQIPGKVAGGRAGARSKGQGGRIDWPASLLQGRPQRCSDLVRQPRSTRPQELWMVVVDASASTRRHGALAKAKGLLAEVFASARKQRVRLALLQAMGNQAQWLWHGQNAPGALQDWLESLGAGGGTPLIDALQQASLWQGRRQRLHPGELHRLLVITDGRIREWPTLAPSGCPALLIDIESAPIRLGRAQQLARQLGAQYHHIDSLPALPAAL